MLKSSNPRVVVIGAGVVGCATAYQLTRAGYHVTLIERDAIAAHASTRNAGHLNPLQGNPPHLRPLALEALRLHRQIRAELADLGCAAYEPAPVGRIYLGYDAQEHAPLEDMAALFNAHTGFRATWLTCEELLRLEPRLAGDTAFGVLVEGNLTVDGGDLSRSLVAGATRLGCSFLRESVSGVTACGDRTTSVNTSSGAVACDALVLATGPWVAQTLAWLGVETPIEPLKGEILRLRPFAGRALDYDLTWGGTSIYRRGADEVWIGTTMTESGLDATPSAAGRELLLERATRIVPDVKGNPVLQHWAAVRPMSRTGAPIAARAAGWQNVYIANGGGSKGLLWSVAIGRNVVGLLRDGRSAPTI